MLSPTDVATPNGTAFAGILDGDWTWAVDVLLDGRTAMGPGRWPHRIIDRSVDQRLEKHALLASVRHLPHRTFTIITPPGAAPAIDETIVPPPIQEATGPADLWYGDSGITIEVMLVGWPPGHDRWTVRCFSTEPDRMRNADIIVNAAAGGRAGPADWCTLCATPLAPGTTCAGPPRRLRTDLLQRIGDHAAVTDWEQFLHAVTWFLQPASGRGDWSNRSRPSRLHSWPVVDAVCLLLGAVEDEDLRHIQDWIISDGQTTVERICHDADQLADLAHDRGNARAEWFHEFLTEAQVVVSGIWPLGYTPTDRKSSSASTRTSQTRTSCSDASPGGRPSDVNTQR